MSCLSSLLRYICSSVVEGSCACMSQLFAEPVEAYQMVCSSYRPSDSASAPTPSSTRFHGVVGYHICLTRSRSSVRFRVEPFLFCFSFYLRYLDCQLQLCQPFARANSMKCPLVELVAITSSLKRPQLNLNPSTRAQWVRARDAWTKHCYFTISHARNENRLTSTTSLQTS